MTDINPDDAPDPIQVSQSPTSEQAGTAVRDILLVLSALPALMAVLGKHDFSAVVAYVSSVQFAPALGVIVAGGTFLWRQWIARRRHAETLKMAKIVPDSVAAVK